MHVGQEEQESWREVLSPPVVHNHRGALYMLPIHLLFNLDPLADAELYWCALFGAAR